MAITDELRDYAHDCCARVDDAIHAIADRIDAEHAEAKRRWMAELDAARDRDGYIELPKDADGEYIHIGDRMENGERVERIVLTDGSWEPSVYLAKTPHVLNQYFCSEISHYHASTVEDVLEELLREYDRDDTELCDGEIIERFAAKLRLAESEES